MMRVKKIQHPEQERRLLLVSYFVHGQQHNRQLFNERDRE